MRLAAVSLLTLFALALAACGEDSEDSASDKAAQEEKKSQEREAPKKADPISCLTDAGLSDVEARDKDLWRGFAVDGTLVRVDLFGSAAEAKKAVEMATDVAAASARRYGVFGPVKDSDDGSTDAVASCLKTG